MASAQSVEEATLKIFVMGSEMDINGLCMLKGGTLVQVGVDYYIKTDNESGISTHTDGCFIDISNGVIAHPTEDWEKKARVISWQEVMW